MNRHLPPAGKGNQARPPKRRETLTAWVTGHISRRPWALGPRAGARRSLSERRLSLPLSSQSQSKPQSCLSLAHGGHKRRLKPVTVTATGP